jgi:hypothetical protein
MSREGDLTHRLVLSSAEDYPIKFFIDLSFVIYLTPSTLSGVAFATGVPLGMFNAPPERFDDIKCVFL